MSRSTPLVARIRDLAGERFGGAYDEVGRDATLRSVQDAVQMARAAGADGIVAIGAGSVMMAGRMVAILLAEDRTPDQMMTRTTAEGAPVSPRLDAAKPPILNVLTAATNAQGRAGSSLMDREAGRRMEYFDPKTRPAAIFWDRDALMTAPPGLARNAGLATFWWALMWVGSAGTANPLVQGDRLQGFRLASEALPRVQDPDARIAMCAAAFLQNRDEDMGGKPFLAHWVSRACYALGAGVLTVSDGANVGDVYAALTIPAARQFAGLCGSVLAAMSRALGTEPADDATEAFATAFDRVLDGLGGRVRLRDVVGSKSALPAIRDVALRSYNADPAREFRNYIPQLDAVLDEAW